MKAAAFDYERPSDLASALQFLDQGEAVVKVLAGGQSLGPMMNLRLVQPDLLVDVTAIPELTTVREEPDACVIGACVTTAAIEDGRIPDVTNGALTTVAAAIAYRAVRNRGTIGGSLAHADPAADWLTALSALGAEAIIVGRSGRRSLPIADFALGAFETVLGTAELLESVRVPRCSEAARWGYYKFCRKTGEFAEAIGAILVDPDRDICRAVIGGTDSKPLVVTDARSLFGGSASIPLHERFEPETFTRLLDAAGLPDDPYARQVHKAALKRAAERLTQ